MLEVYPLSRQQAQAWSGGLTESRRARLALEIPPAERAAVSARLQTSLVRHECLRTRFLRTPGAPQPFQLVEAQATPEGLTHRWEERDASLHLYLETSALALDGASLLALAAELAGLAPFPEPPAQYLDAEESCVLPAGPDWVPDFLEGGGPDRPSVEVEAIAGTFEPAQLEAATSAWLGEGAHFGTVTGPTAEGLGLYAMAPPGFPVQLEILSLPQLPPGWRVLEVDSHPQPYLYKVVALLGSELRLRACSTSRDAAWDLELLRQLRAFLEPVPASTQLEMGNPPVLPSALELVLEAAGRFPERPALQCQGRTWSYNQLAQRAGEFAAHFQRLGLLGTVAVAGPLDFECLAGWLGAWWAGATVWLVDPATPPGRLHSLLEMAQARLCVGGHLPGLERVDGRGGTAPVPTPTEIAYLCFTSGTTGEPKAVRAPQAALSHFLSWQGDTFRVNESDRIAHSTRLSFDVVYREVLVGLIRGACLCVPPADLEPNAWIEWLADEGITLLHAVPSLGRWWHSQASPRRLALRCLFWAGEPLPTRLLRDWWRDLAPACQMVNLYGPSETVLAKCWAVYTESDPLALEMLPVGRPLPDCRVEVLRHGVACPAGQRGEVFLTTPWSQGPYATGDLGRFGADGNLEVLGRRDDQLKIHGVRLSLGEVSRVLESHPRVRAAAVLFEAERLVAYLAAPDDLEEDLRRHCASHLVSAAWPALYHFLERLPLTAHGKLDRAALSPRRTAEEKPASPYENELAQVVAQVLGLERVALDIPLLALGAHSLQLLSLAAHLEARFGLDVPLEFLFHSPTVRQLAGLSAKVEEAPACERQLSYVQESLWLASQLDPAAYNEPLALRIQGPLDRERLQAVWSELCRRQEMLRSSYTAVEGVPHCQVADRLETGIASAEGALEQLAANLLAEPFALDQAPLWRLRLVRLGPEDHWLVGAVHHLIFDAWSRWLLWEALMRGYAGTLGDSPRSYREFAARPFRASRLDYWQTRLHGYCELAWPEAGGARTLEATVAWATSEKLARDCGATPFMVLLTAMGRALAEQTGQSNLVLGTPVAHRPAGFQDTLGCFLNLLALRLEVGQAGNLSQAVKRLRGPWLEDYAHQDCPFEKVVERLAPERRLGRTPLVDVLVNLVNVPFWGEPREEAGLTWSSQSLAARKPRFLFTLYARPQGENLRLVLVPDPQRVSPEQAQALLQRVLQLLQNPSADWPALTDAPAPEATPAPLASEREPVLEAYLQELYGQLLGQPVTREHGFFAAGGHSLLASMAIARMREDLGVDLPLRLIYQYQRIGDLAPQLRSQLQAGPLLGAAWSQAQKGLLQRMAGEAHGLAHWNIPRATLWTGPLDRSQLEKAIGEVVAFHGLDRIWMGTGTGEVSIHWEAVSGDGHEERLREALRPFQLSSQPAFRFRVLKLAPEVHQLLCTAHHLAADCWSLGITGPQARDWLPGLLFGQVWQAYHGPWPPPGTPLAHGALGAWQENWLTSQEGQLQAEHWRRKLDGSQAVSLPVKRPQGWSYQGLRPPWRLNDALTKRLSALVEARGARLQHALLAAYALLLREWTGQEDLVIVTPMANRNLPGSTDSLGWFSNTVPLRLRVVGEFLEVLEEVRATWFEALAYQEFPLEAMTGVPPLRVRFLYHVARDYDFRQAGLAMTPLPIVREVAKHDLTLWCMQGPGGLSGWTEYASDLLEAEEVATRMERWRQILEAAVS